MTTSVFEYKYETAKSFVKEVMDRSGQNLAACYQCRRCAAGCPVGEETGYLTPDRLIRMIIVGDREKVFNNELVWKCVSCATCGTRCPNGIHTVRITETLKKMAKESNAKPIHPKVSHFHEAFINSGVSQGRVNEMLFMGEYVLKNSISNAKEKDLKAIYDEFSNLTKTGLAMTKQKRMHFGFQWAKGRDEIKRLYKKAKEKRK